MLHACLAGMSGVSNVRGWCCDAPDRNSSAWLPGFGGFSRAVDCTAHELGNRKPQRCLEWCSDGVLHIGNPLPPFKRLMTENGSVWCDLLKGVCVWRWWWFCYTTVASRVGWPFFSAPSISRQAVKAQQEAKPNKKKTNAVSQCELMGNGTHGFYPRFRLRTGCEKWEHRTKHV